MAQQKNINTLARLVTGESWPEPIPVGERMPEQNQDAMVYDSWNHLWSTMTYRGDGFWYSHLGNFETSNITHWLPLPPSPQQH